MKKINIYQKVKENNGITLVALVITIVILMIIAGVGLNIAVGENGIFTKAKQAANTYLYSAKSEQAELDKVFAELEGLTGADKKNAYALKLQEQGFSATQIDTGYLKADTSRDDYVTLYTLDENGNEVSSEQIQYTNPELFLFDASSGAITGINYDISDDVYYADVDGVSLGNYIQNNTLVIPNKINGVQVKSVVLCAERDDWNYKSDLNDVETIIIPNGVETIGDNCFRTCQDLEQILLPNSLKTIGYEAFYGGWACKSIKNINLPSNLETIEERAFYGCEDLQSIVIPNKVTQISSQTFEKCFSLESVTIGNNVRTIGVESFQMCRSLKEVIIPNSVKEIKGCAFDECDNLEEVYIPSSVIEIQGRAFRKMKINSIIYVENQAIYNLLTVYFGADDARYTYGLTKIIVDPTRTAGKDEPVYYYTADTSNDSYCTLYTRDKYGNIIKEERIEYADGNIFDFDTSMGEIKGFNYSSEDVYYEQFEGINIEGIGEVLAFPKKINGVQVKSISELLKYFSHGIIGVKKVIIPNGVEKINNSAFIEYWWLENITLPNSVTSIGAGAFSNCSSLKEVTIPNSVTSIGAGAFSNCSSLKEVTIPSSVTSIGNAAFGNCRSLKEVRIPNSVTSIGGWAFSNLAQDSIIYVQSEAVKIRLSGKYDSSNTTVVVDPSKF